MDTDRRPQRRPEQRTGSRPSFTAPGDSATLVFQLTVRDNEDEEDRDSVTVQVGSAPPPEPPSESD